jgi:predicted TIM-barrel fold metal-dependent hydrolase
MYSYFKKEENDSVFYNTFIKDRLPDNVFDAHSHVNRPEHVTNVSEETIKSDWALECGLVMTDEDAQAYYATLFPDKVVDNVIFPWPLPEGDTKGNNAYIARLISEKKKTGLMSIRPEWDTEYIEDAYIKGGFRGFKPYPYFAAAVKGADVSIFDFMPEAHFALADKLNAAVLMHLPRKGRLPDDGNIVEIRRIVEKYPNVKLVIAHLGRCFNLAPLKEGLEKLGDHVKAVYFDTAAVMNPDVLSFAFEQLRDDQILYGTDFPILLWHGKREWSKTQYFNLCREDFSWNTHKYPEQERAYTFFVYEQIRNILDVIDQASDGKALAAKIFRQNAIDVYKK